MTVMANHHSNASLLVSLAQKSLMTFLWSTGVSLFACIRARDDSRSVRIVDRMYVFTLLVVLNDLPGVAVNTDMVKRMVSMVAS